MLDFLGISRSHLAMIETNQRNERVNTALTVLQFYKAMSGSEAINDVGVKAALKEQDAKKKKEIKFRLARCKYHLRLATESLEKMREDQSRSLKVIASLPALNKSAESYDGILIRSIERRARQLQEKSGAHQQLKLELKIAALAVEMKILEE